MHACEKGCTIGGGGGGGDCHWRLYQMRENCPQKSTLNEGFMVDQKIPLTGHTGQISHPKEDVIPKSLLC